MNYSGFGLLSLAVYVIINNRLLRSISKKELSENDIKYRSFLISVILYMFTDIIWGIAYEWHLIKLVYIDTAVYFMLMALSVLMWTRFVVSYLNNGNLFDTILTYTGWIIFTFVMSCLLVNFMYPILFSFDQNGVYTPHPIRYLFLIAQVFLFAATTLCALITFFKSSGENKQHTITITISCIVMIIFIILQTCAPLLPLYNIGCLFASCLVHVFLEENEARKKNRKLSKALWDAEKASAAKATFLANMSHEIRTPINTIIGMNEIILRDSNDDKVISCAENIRESATSLLRIISGILEFSNVEIGETELVNVEYYMPELIDDLYNFIRFRVEDKGLELHMDIDPNLPKRVIGDELKIKQVITHLLTNAVKFTDKGKIIFRARLRGIEGENAHIRFTVTDTGLGIKDADKEKLFIAFERIDTEKENSEKGTGVGLAMSAHLLDMMGSKFNVQSIHGMGSEFSFELTQQITDKNIIGSNWKNEVNSVTETKKQEHHSFKAPDCRMLLVDDTDLNLEVICGLLEPTKIKIDTASSGEECIRKFGENSYDIVFLDYMMPKMDGIETLKRMKEDYPEKTLATPVISFTASAVSGERERMLSEGFTDYLTKPVVISKMMDMLIKYLPESKISTTDESDLQAQDVSSEQTHEVSFEGIPRELSELPWINVSEGIDYCGTPETYMMALSIFVKGIEDKAALLEDCLSKDDIKLFTINVHAIKSSALTVGMADISAKAKELELLGKAGDREKIDDKFPGFIEDFRNLATVLEKLVG